MKPFTPADAAALLEVARNWQKIEAEVRRFGVPEPHVYATAARIMNAELGLEK